MPYIKQDLRDWMRDPINVVVSLLRDIPEHMREGAVNYTITSIVAGSFAAQAETKERWSYRTAYRAYGTLLAAAAEFYRRVLVPVEDNAIARNGDISEYQL